MTVTGLSRAQITRLIGQSHGTSRIRGLDDPTKPFVRCYTAADCRALAGLDALHGQLSGPATRRLYQRACHIFDDALLLRKV
jgi:hypothetical protein